MNIPKCKMSVSGKHNFIEGIPLDDDNSLRRNPIYVAKCRWCNLIDDRKNKTK